MRVFLLLLLAAASYAQVARKVAVTIDDLPLGGPGVCGADATTVREMTRRLLAPFRQERLPVIGFVNAGRCRQWSDAELQSVLKVWLDAGAELGNHSYSHPDFNQTSLSDYTADILKGEPALRTALGKQPEYFRHPMLHAGPDVEKSRGLRQFLAEHRYTVAPVTLDNSDYMFALVYREAKKRGDEAFARKVKDAYLPYMESIFAFFESRSVEVVGREFPQTLLIHANELNADVMPDLLAMMKRRGYGFVSLREALRDEAYRLPDEYVGPGGFSWIHRWSKTKGMKPKGEPDEPAFIREAFQKRNR